MEIKKHEEQEEKQTDIKVKVMSAPTKIIHKMKKLRERRLERNRKKKERTERIKKKGKRIKVYMDIGFDD